MRLQAALIVRDEARGVMGIPRDLGQPDGQRLTYDRLRRLLDCMNEHHAESLRVQALAELAALSIAQLWRHFRRVFPPTPPQVLCIEAAMRALQGSETIASIELSYGFVDPSAFARQFKATDSMTPRDDCIGIAGERGQNPRGA